MTRGLNTSKFSKEEDSDVEYYALADEQAVNILIYFIFPTSLLTVLIKNLYKQAKR